MNRLIILFVVFEVIYGCQPDGFNQCKSNGDCCSNNCYNPGTWAVGVCHAGNNVNPGGQCHPDGWNQCHNNNECCSKKCYNPGNWAFGVCQANGDNNNNHNNNNGAVTHDEFVRAVTSNGYPAPNQDQYNTFVGKAAPAGGITNKQELAMFLAQILWESGGLKYKKEIRCAQSNCPGEYRSGGEKPGKYYYGRGYIQLTWLANYQQCSQALYGDNRLVENPDLVSNTEDGAWGSAFWFWKKNVHSVGAVQQGHFGATTNAINGGLECRGQRTDIAKKRYAIYINVLRAFNLGNVKPIESGCYN